MDENTSDPATYAMLYIIVYGPILWLGITCLFANTDDG